MASVFKRGGKKNRGGPYYISWNDHTDKRRSKSTQTTDKATAERIVAKLEADAALRREGVVDPALDAIGQQSRRSIESHLGDYEAKMNAANRDEKHIGSTLAYIQAICKANGFATVVDITADGANRYAGQLKERGKSARTVQAYLTSIKGFTRWLTENHKLLRDPLASIRKPNPKADRRYERRMLLPEEWRWMEAATASGPARFDMSSNDRLLLYGTAIQTGLRSAELRSLTRGRLYLDANPPFITCKTGPTKNRKGARQYIHAELADDLRAHLATKAPRAKVFAMPDNSDVAVMFRADLAEARREWMKSARGDPEEYSRRDQSDFLAAVNHDGEFADFHSLRHTTGAWLAMVGVHPNAVQAVMRHLLTAVQNCSEWRPNLPSLGW